MRTAESDLGSSASTLIRLKVSRQEIPASTRIFVVDVCTSALFPRLPLASNDTDTLILLQHNRSLCGRASTFLVSRDLRACRKLPGIDALERRVSLLVSEDVADGAAHHGASIRAGDRREKRQKGLVDLRAIWFFREDEISQQFGDGNANAHDEHPPPRFRRSP